MECVELAPAVGCVARFESGSKLHALHTLRETRPPLSSVCAICSVSPEDLRKKTRFSPMLSSAPFGGQNCEIGPILQGRGALGTDAPCLLRFQSLGLTRCDASGHGYLPTFF